MGNRFSPLRRDDCKDAGGSATHGAVAVRVGGGGNKTKALVLFTL